MRKLALFGFAVCTASLLGCSTWSTLTSSFVQEPAVTFSELPQQIDSGNRARIILDQPAPSSTPQATAVMDLSQQPATTIAHQVTPQAPESMRPAATQVESFQHASSIPEQAEVEHDSFFRLASATTPVLYPQDTPTINLNAITDPLDIVFAQNSDVVEIQLAPVAASVSPTTAGTNYGANGILTVTPSELPPRSVLDIKFTDTDNQEATKQVVVTAIAPTIEITDSVAFPNQADGETLLVDKDGLKLQFKNIPAGLPAKFRIYDTATNKSLAPIGITDDQNNSFSVANETPFQLPILKEKTTIEIQLVNELQGTVIESKLAEFEVVPASPTIRPAIDSFKTSPRSPWQPLTDQAGQTDAGKVTLFSSNNTPGFLEIRGQGRHRTTDQLVFFASKADGSEAQELSVANRNAVITPLTNLPNGAWSAVLQIPVELGPGKLVTRLSRDGEHGYVEEEIHFAISTSIATGTSPITGLKVNGAESKDATFFINNISGIKITGTETLPSNANLFLHRENQPNEVIGALFSTDALNNWELEVDGLLEGTNRLQFSIEQGTTILAESAPFVVNVRETGPKVLRVEPENFGVAPGIKNLTIFFDPKNKLNISETLSTNELTKNYFQLRKSNGTGAFGAGFDTEISITATIDEFRNTVTLTPADNAISPDMYQLRIVGSKITDIFGNELEGIEGQPGSDYIKVLGQSQAASQDSPGSITPGISGTTGAFVPYSEFTKPRDVPDGFNPNDKVETRVARLYFYRDAHRVAQIINRKAKSYNRQGVDTQRQLADKARTQADQATIARQQAERSAIASAQQTRQKERELRQAENSMQSLLNEVVTIQRQREFLDPTSEEFQKTTSQLTALQASADAFSGQVANLRSTVQSLRDSEVATNELVKRAESTERLAREDLFRRQVAAAHADPDTYAPGVPGSDDPVEQVSVSVIGEGLLQLRGPLKGINLIRTAIDQLDSPVGQVRIAVHSVQINGERAERLEVVSKQVQQYIDQARFLTLQSAEMLRKAVIKVASEKAEEARGLYANDTSADRDQRYLHAFFGKDFIDELRAMDSEFLHSGNKLLSLHSMDTTSLASALNLMALAKNSTRHQIMECFEQMLVSELPQAESNFISSGEHYQDCEPCKRRGLFQRCQPELPQTHLLAQNAKFESLKGFFNSQTFEDDTLTPLQREFIRLAQIFKSRLITEMEFKQRVRERAIIEERLGNRNEELRLARKKEAEANEKLDEKRESLIAQRVEIMTVIPKLAQNIDDAIDNAFDEYLKNLDIFTEIVAVARSSKNPEKVKLEYENYIAGGGQLDKLYQKLLTLDKITAAVSLDKNPVLYSLLYGEPPTSFPAPSNPKYTVLNTNRSDFLTIIDTSFGQLKIYIEAVIDLQKSTLRNKVDSELTSIQQMLADDSFEAGKVYSRWYSLQKNVISKLEAKGFNLDELKPELEKLDLNFRNMLKSGFESQFAEQNAKKSRRQLDYKKFLDMLIDDLEEKYIELLEGTRAHTANIDNYLKRITTALDDDFNTQFYHPTFRHVRQASQFHDVQFGQTETTNVLANNRAFAKVDPAATMEFDLPRRDLLITEGISSARGVYGEIGALANDPNFLALARLKSGQPTSESIRSMGGYGAVRDVLPGLNSGTAEQIISQNANGESRFGANLENLIPDPAVYKFETGTGYEIRPVIQPDGQAVVFDFDYMYTTKIREPVRADEKHLGRVKRHFIHTDVQLSNFEMREVSRYTVALRASRTANGAPLLEDLPVAGKLFRPLASDEKSLQQNLVMAQATIFPTLFDLMGLRWAPVVADLDSVRLSNSEFVVRNRKRILENRVYDEASTYVDDFLRIPDSQRRMDLYRSQETVPAVHPNGYSGPGLDLRDSQLQEGFQLNRAIPAERFAPAESQPNGDPRAPRQPSFRRGYKDSEPLRPSFEPQE